MNRNKETTFCRLQITIGLLWICRFAKVARMSDDAFDIHYAANLARIELTDEEEAQMGAQLGDILGYVEKLKELNVDNVEPTAHAYPVKNVTRPDEARQGLTHEEALSNAPRVANGLIRVPKIVE